MAEHRKGVILVDSKVLSGKLLRQVLEIFSLALTETEILTNCFADGKKLPIESSSANVVVSVAETPGHHSVAFLTEISRILHPGGNLVVQEPIGRRKVATEESKKLGALVSSIQSKATLGKSLLFSGFAEATITAPVVDSGLSIDWTGVTPASIGSTQGPLLEPLTIQAKKPVWELGKSFGLKKKVNQTTHGPAKAINGGRVTISLDDVDDNALGVSQAPPASHLSNVTVDDDDLVDEDTLLTEEDLAPPEAVPEVDCGDGRVGKKACKNCSCGRAELEEKEETQKLTIDQIANPQSACGSCGLGDAFRCGGCPYRGLPAFKLGEKISLSSDFLRADA